jgi:hypothetical protein
MLINHNNIDSIRLGIIEHGPLTLDFQISDGANL